MNQQEAKNLIRDTFQNPFDEQRFRLFAKNLFNDLDESKAFSYQGQFIPDAYKDHVRRYKRIGKYTDPEGAALDVLIVSLKREAALDRARTMQRNFISWYLKQRGEKEAAIVAYHSDGLEDWRFSYIRMDYRAVLDESGKVCVKTDLTPARRYSFLVGLNEPNHTAQQQLLPILQDDRNNPALAEIEKAFNIESVTKEFFERYKGLFLKIKEELDELVNKDRRIGEDFTTKGIGTADFAKKLLGQIVFLYFLQKKGWLGVGRDETGRFKNWGAGPKDFLRQLIDGKIGSGYANFFNDVLEHLFYEALAFPRENDFYSRLECKIPFLNGGLFEPINGYNWQETDILIRNETFGEIFDTFDQYNFTVREDEPLEKEVAVDPEMLGKVFENLLEVKDRKSKGAYYTPREIVHYMCQQSLICYLDSALNRMDMEQPSLLAELHETVPLDDLEIFIRSGEFIVENDKRVVAVGRETERYSLLMPETVRNNAMQIDDALARVRICDPAVGSGAFPVGMLHEVVKAREIVATYIGRHNHRSRYSLKRHAIQESIFGVDIDPAAVEIAKLRLWLSLVVDEDDYLSIKPLPNLDYKIMQGNSLLEEYEGIKLFDDRLITASGSEKDEELDYAKERFRQLEHEHIRKHEAGVLSDVERNKLKADIKKQELLVNRLAVRDKGEEAEVGLFAGDAAKISAELKGLHKQIFEASDKAAKDSLRKRIEKLEWRLIEETLREQKKENLLSDIQMFKKSSHKPFFIWKLHFSEVFQEKSGFDVLIANPPYVRHEAIRELKPFLSREFGKFYCGTADLYTYFYRRGLQILKPGGHLCFIAPNKFMRAGYGKNTRVLLTGEATPRLVIDFGDLPIFDATTYPAVLLVEKSANPPSPPFAKVGNKECPPLEKGDAGGFFRKFTAATFKTVDQIACVDETLKTIGFPMPVSALRPEGWNLEQPEVLALMEKLRKAGKPLGEYVQGRFYRGILTGLNEAFVIDAETRDRLIAEDPKSAELIKPWLRGRDIKKWRAEWAGLYVIAIASSANRAWPWSDAETEQKARAAFENAYPAVHKHLSRWETRLIKRDDQGRFWWELRSCAYWEEFQTTKVLYPDIAQHAKFLWDDSGFFSSNTTYFIPTQEDWLLGLLNSRLIWWFYGSITASIRGGFVRYFTQYMEQLPIPPASAAQKAPIIERVQRILSAPDSPDTPRLEAEIDRLVYELYGLTDGEIALVEGKK